MHSIITLLALTGAAIAQTASTGVSASVRVSSPIPTGTVTQVVTSTIYCPGPTTFICGGTTYSPTAATTITATCTGGCYVTPAPIPASNQVPPVPASSKIPPPPAYTGAADKLQVGGALMAAAIGLVVL